MKTTATKLVTFVRCPFLFRVLYEVREPLPVLGTRRLFGNVIHSAIAAYEQRRSLNQALEVLDHRGKGLSGKDLAEARSILEWRHVRAASREGKPVLVEGSLRASASGHRLEVRMDRLDATREGFLLAEYKGGSTVDIDLVRVQLMILSYAIYDVFGRVPRRWELELLRQRRVLSLDPDTSALSLEAFTSDLVARVSQPAREPDPHDPKFCARCPAHPYCPRHHRTPKEFSRNHVDCGQQLFLF